MRQLKVPRADEMKMARAITHEVRSLFPLPLNELAWAYVPLDRRSPQMLHATRTCDILAMAAKRVQLQDRLSRLQALGLGVDVVQCDCVALWNLLAHEYLPTEPTTNGEQASVKSVTPVAVLDIGSTWSNFFVVSPEVAWLRTTGLATDQFNSVLTRELGLTLAQAEQFTRNPAAAPDVAELYEVLEAVFEQFYQELEHWLVEVREAHFLGRVDRIFGCGGGFLVHGLLKHLQRGAVEAAS